MQMPILQDEIKKVIPQREPFLFLDEITSFDESMTCGAYTFRAEDPVFKGHFPDDPIVPGVLLLECLAQTGAFAALVKPESAGKNAYLLRVNNAKIKRMVRPGERIETIVQAGRAIGAMTECHAVAKVAGEVAAECELMCALVKKE